MSSTASSATRNRPNVLVNREPRAATVRAPPASHFPAATSVSPRRSSSHAPNHPRQLPRPPPPPPQLVQPVPQPPRQLARLGGREGEFSVDEGEVESPADDRAGRYHHDEHPLQPGESAAAAPHAPVRPHEI